MAADHQYGFTKAEIARTFNRAVKSYDCSAILQTTVGERLLERLDLVNINPLLILDLGAATGNFTHRLQQRYKSMKKGTKVIGVDLASQMSVYANKQRKWLAKERYICADAEYLPFADQSVQLVFSNLMLQWIENPDCLFKEIKRILVPGGLLMFTTYGPDSLMEMRQSWQMVDNRVHVNRFMDMHDIGDSLTQSGFEGTVMDNEMITMTYDAIADLHHDLRNLGEVNLNVGRNKSLTGTRLWKNYLTAYQQFRTHDGIYPASWEIVYGHAWARDTGIDNGMDNQSFAGDIKVHTL